MLEDDESSRVFELIGRIEIYRVGRNTCKSPVFKQTQTAKH